ncbi:MAG: hypothetical protein Q9209_002447 [Squamulea sp. 1 TL-2023]
MGCFASKAETYSDSESVLNNPWVGNLQNFQGQLYNPYNINDPNHPSNPYAQDLSTRYYGGFTYRANNGPPGSPRYAVHALANGMTGISISDERFSNKNAEVRADPMMWNAWSFKLAAEWEEAKGEWGMPPPRALRDVIPAPSGPPPSTELSIFEGEPGTPSYRVYLRDLAREFGDLAKEQAKSRKPLAEGEETRPSLEKAMNSRKSRLRDGGREDVATQKVLKETGICPMGFEWI